MGRGQYTHLIGQGDAITSVSPLGTTIQVSGTFSGSSSMIQFGSSSGCCTAISVENLTLDGKAKTGVSGIVNQYAGDLSYVDHVGLYRILGTGLSVSGSATNPVHIRTSPSTWAAIRVRIRRPAPVSTV
jgi:hypothetical protein